MKASDDLTGFLTLSDCAVHGREHLRETDYQEHAETREACGEDLALAIDKWNGENAQGLTTEIQGQLEQLRERSSPEGVETTLGATIAGLQMELASISEEANAECPAVVDFLLARYGSGAMPRLDLVVLTGRLKVLAGLQEKGRLDLTKQIVVHMEHSQDTPGAE
eukprot:2833742-Rhodomonas_salina.1